MKAFVTGGTGFIGSHLVDRLIEDPQWDEVRCLVRQKEKWLAGKSYTRLAGDLYDMQVMKHGLEGVDVLFHLAGVVKAPDYRQFEQVNVEGTENLVRLAINTGVKKIVVLSSLAAAGPSNDLPLTEDLPMKPVSQYGRSKMQMEQMLQNLVDDTCSLTIIRPPVVYGPREDQLYTYFKIMNKRISPVVGDGRSLKVSMVYVTDLIKGMLLAANNDSPGLSTYYISGPDIVNWTQIKQTAATVLGKKPITIHLKPQWVKKVAHAVETTASIFGSYPVFNREKANEMILQWTCSSEKAKKELNYFPDVTLEEGVARTIHWYKRHYWL